MTTIRDLPPDILRDIICREACEARRCVAPLVCKCWRRGLGTLSELRLPPQLPWLLRPETEEGSVPAFSCLLCDDARATATIHHLRISEEIHGARYIGSYDDRWLIFSPVHGQAKCVLYNMRSKERHVLPNKAWVRGSHFFYPMDAAAVTLSCAPHEDYLGAAIVHGVPRYDSSRIVFWKKGSRLALDPYSYSDGNLIDIEVQDAIYYRGSFLVLVEKEGLHLWKVEICKNEAVMRENQRVFFIPASEAYQYIEQYVTGHYLVESRGNLLMVLKCAHRNFSAKRFRIFEMQLKTPEIEFDIATFKWTETLELEGRMVFLAKGCSRCYETSVFPGCQDGVYFLDDRQDSKSFRNMLQTDEDVPLILRSIVRTQTVEDMTSVEGGMELLRGSNTASHR